MNVGEGEYILLKYAPTFKWRYTADSDIYLGCRIGCIFCYYRMIDYTEKYIGTGELDLLATPEEYQEFVYNSKLMMDTDLIILGARGDASMYPNHVSIVAEYIQDKKFLCLRRAVYNEDVIHHLTNHNNIYYGTTITPNAVETGSPVSDEQQLKGLEKTVEKGVKPEKISVEVGPITPSNIEKIDYILYRLSDIGFKHYIYRGVSVGSWRIDSERIIEKLRRRNFIYTEPPEKKEYFYILKNYVPETLEKYILEKSREYNLNPHRHTGLYYRKVWGIPVAGNRRNRPRIELMENRYIHNPRNAIRNLEEYGYHIYDYELRGDGWVHVYSDKPITEDVAMRIGAIYNIVLTSENYIHSPDKSMLKHYIENRLVYIDGLRYRDKIYSELNML